MEAWLALSDDDPDLNILHVFSFDDIPESEYKALRETVSQALIQIELAKKHGEGILQYLDFVRGEAGLRTLQ